MNFCLKVPSDAEMVHKNRHSYITPALLDEQVHSSNVNVSVCSEGRT